MGDGGKDAMERAFRPARPESLTLRLGLYFVWEKIRMGTCFSLSLETWREMRHCDEAGRWTSDQAH